MARPNTDMTATNPMGLAPIALSFSRLSRFETCPSSFEHLYVNKTVKDTGNDKSLWGDRVHEGLETYGRALASDDLQKLEAIEELDTDAAKWFGLVRRIMARPGEKFFEHQMAVRRNLTPCGWFDKDVWIRSIADVLVVDGPTAYCFDWKTGKVKNDQTQLQLFAAMIMQHFPEVTKVVSSYVWLIANDIYGTTYQREYLRQLWGSLLPRLKAVQDAVDLGVFPTKPSGLCPWCPAKDICADARPGRRS